MMNSFSVAKDSFRPTARELIDDEEIKKQFQLVNGGLIPRLFAEKSKFVHVEGDH